jgi:PAS domain S-box-containing protein
MFSVPDDMGFRWIFEAAVDAMLIVDPAGAILLGNASCERLFGYPREELVSRRVEDLIPQRFRSVHRGYHATFAANPVPRPMARGTKLCAVRRDGSEFRCKVSLSPLPQGDAHLVLAVVEDISQLSGAEEELDRRARQIEDRETMLGMAVRLTGLGSWEWFPHNDAIRLSPEWKTQLGYGEDEVPNLADEWRNRLHPDDRALTKAVGDEFRSGARREADIRYRMRHRDGEYRWLEARGVLLEQAGQPARVLGVQWDVTAQVQMQQRMAERRDAVADLRQVQIAFETAAVIAHELNQPLNAVTSYCEAAQRMWRAGTPEKLDYALDSAVVQAGRAGQVVRDLLRFLDRQDLPVTAIELDRVIREAVADVAADDHGSMRVDLALTEDLPPVQAGEVQVKKVIINLLRNAAEAMAGVEQANGAVGVATSLVEDGTMARVSVSDRGPALDPAMVERLFEPFFTTKARGIGMGLATSRRVIERLGGKLWYEANPGGGAVFNFTLPVAP